METYGQVIPFFSCRHCLWTPDIHVHDPLQFLFFLNYARTGVVSGKCFDDHFWYSPGCRDVPQSCLVWYTGGNGWGMNEMSVKATIFNMPVALVVASSGANYASVPNDLTNLMLYWWVPDPTFLRPPSASKVTCDPIL